MYILLQAYFYPNIQKEKHGMFPVTTIFGSIIQFNAMAILWIDSNKCNFHCFD